MRITTEHNALITYLAKYLGVALIAGSVVHIGTLQNGVTRYVILIIIGLIMTLVGNLKEARANGQQINVSYFVVITLLSFATGFLSGGIQHYLDNPSYAGILLGIGLVVTYVTFCIKEHYQLKRTNIAIVIILALACILFSHFVIDDTLLGDDHHAHEDTGAHTH